jgi:hypothetical protein
MGGGEVAMTSDIIERPCRRCGEHAERIRTIDGKLATWWLIACTCGRRWIPVVAWPRSRRRAAA